MNLFHAVVWTDHHHAEVLSFDDEQVVERKLAAHVHPTAQHGSAVRTQHEFHAALCDAMEGIAEVLVVGSHTALADFRHHVEKHRPALARHVAAWQVGQHASPRQLVAQAREFFVRHDRMTGTPTPG